MFNLSWLLLYGIKISNINFLIISTELFKVYFPHIIRILRINFSYTEEPPVPVQACMIYAINSSDWLLSMYSGNRTDGTATIPKVIVNL